MKMIDLKLLAKSFSMNINDFAAAMGYSRQGLYVAIKEKRAHAVRMVSALQHMKKISDSIIESDIEKAKAKAYDREKGLRDIAELCGLIWNSEEKNHVDT